MTVNPLKESILNAIREHIGTIPPHVQACASAIRYDLMHGPSWSLIPQGNIELFTADHYATFREDLEEEIQELDGDILEETYVGIVAQTLRDYIDGLPCALYVEENSGFVSNCEPEGEWLNEDYEPCDSDDEGAQWFEPEQYYTVERKNIVESIFGRTIAREFS